MSLMYEFRDMDGILYGQNIVLPNQNPLQVIAPLGMFLNEYYGISDKMLTGPCDGSMIVDALTGTLYFLVEEAQAFI